MIYLRYNGITKCVSGVFLSTCHHIDNGVMILIFHSKIGKQISNFSLLLFAPETSYQQQLCKFHIFWFSFYKFKCAVSFLISRCKDNKNRIVSFLESIIPLTRVSKKRIDLVKVLKTLRLIVLSAILFGFKTH